MSPLTREGIESLVRDMAESDRLEKLTNRELVFEALHRSVYEDQLVVWEMMTRLWPNWADEECPPNCWACKQEQENANSVSGQNPESAGSTR